MKPKKKTLGPFDESGPHRVRINSDRSLRDHDHYHTAHTRISHSFLGLCFFFTQRAEALPPASRAQPRKNPAKRGKNIKHRPCAVLRASLLPGGRVQGNQGNQKESKSSPGSDLSGKKNENISNKMSFKQSPQDMRKAQVLGLLHLQSTPRKAEVVTWGYDLKKPGGRRDNCATVLLSLLLVITAVTVSLFFCLFWEWQSENQK